MSDKGRVMARLISSMIMSLDGYTEDAQGDFGWGAPEDAAVHTSINFPDSFRRRVR